ncbi:BTB/POZ domain-containing protein 6-like [Brevipalpus obovatus]|uniref:BTB/POZ domain-containing protein 6-like n=1 Tax=Brevipalpus obovatus TaxID=246614 RepID=UPI003D9E42F9
MNFDNSDQPSAPSAGLTLFNSEDQSDLIFIVTVDPNGSEEKWRFPAHSFIIQQSSPLFHQLITRIDQHITHENGKPIVNIQCQPEIFYMLMSFIYLKEVDINAIPDSLALLKLSTKFMLIELSQLCLSYIKTNITEDNILHVIEALHKSSADSIKSKSNGVNSVNNNNNNINIIDVNNVQNGPENDDNTDGNHFSSWYEKEINSLLHQCFTLIDEKAEKILKSDGILRLDQRLMKQILSRDTLNISSELDVFQCIDRWSVYQCQKNGQKLSTDNKLNVVNDLLYLVRYLLMNEEEFMRGPFVSDLLPDYDREILRIAITQRSDIVLPEYLRSARLDRPRKYVKPIQIVAPQQRQFIGDDIIPTIRRDSNNNNNNFTDPSSKTHQQLVVARKKGPFKKILNGLGDVMICVIQLLD